ncbi:GT2 family glycosyltransferase/glycosyltransferase involved in cell wall biosynthesis [Variovorax sp. TBS-050B]|uniref:class I SAM-dependent methyltransferase n=1 Tax=Variovorax sp. TBS-050B TaxID=2940551 RepID=UPI002473A1BB|nr:class I SAM-dependent methyltransferase [Variovorax sp. TBS-050B]MDH6592682.1 GT2 family glycosyltransferase/glycosyltransferase involved in cell wall biosynthesis [Variovorax sp. TBS-050B]
MSELDFGAALKEIELPPQPSAWIGHAPFGAWLVESTRPRVLVELGTHHGHSYFSFCQAVDRAGLDCRCYAVDLWKGDEHAGVYGEEVFEGVQRTNHRFQQFSRLLRMTFDDAAALFSDASIDFLHIDGCHSYEAVKHDFEHWRPKLSSRAIVLFHDIGVRERDFGVWRLWRELSVDCPTIQFTHSHGLGVLFFGPDQSGVAASLLQAFGTEAGFSYITRLFAALGRKLELEREIVEMSAALEAQVKAGDARISEMGRYLKQLESQSRSRQSQRIRLEEERAALQSQLAYARQRETELEASLHEVWTSTSWRVTGPIRWSGRQLANLRTVKRLILPASQSAGGPWSLLTSVCRVVAQEGFPGLKRRIVAMGQAPEAGDMGSVLEQRKIHYTLERRHATVDVIVCVHNALADVKNCLSSVVANTLPPYRIIVVDDGSDEDTKNYLAEFIRDQGGVLVRHEVAQGYTLAANAGMRASDAEFVVLLNSDTVVSAQWLDRMVACAMSDPRIGMVGPLSNTASWQSVPHIFDDDGDWSSNPLPPGLSISAMAQWVAMASRRSYPRVGFLNGFCLLIRREQLSDVGLFDEEGFGRGYGEENDMCVRAFSNGWQLAVADDVYVFHAQSKSYSTERRMKLVEAADETLHRKHGSAPILRQLELTQYNLGLLAARTRLQAMTDRLCMREQIRRKFEGKRVLIVLPVGHAGGGANVVLSEASVLQECGVDVVVANLETSRGAFEDSYPDCRVATLWLSDWSQLSEHLHLYDAVLATLYLSVFWIKAALEKVQRRPLVGYYIQDFEPDFYSEGSEGYQQALASYEVAPMTLVAKTQWTRKMVAEKVGKSPALVGPSFDWSRFAPPSTQRNSDRVVLCAMVRPSTPRRAPQLTVNVLHRLLMARPDSIEVRTFGCVATEPILDNLKLLSHYRHHGELNSAEVEALMKRSDVFIDLSAYQAMGLTCLEAMASGATIVGPVNGGLSEIVVDEESGLLVDTHDENKCLEACLRLIDDSELRRRLGAAGVEKTSALFPDRSALALMQQLFPDEGKPEAHQ